MISKRIGGYVEAGLVSGAGWVAKLEKDGWLS